MTNGKTAFFCNASFFEKSTTIVVVEIEDYCEDVISSLWILSWFKKSMIYGFRESDHTKFITWENIKMSQDYCIRHLKQA